MAEYDAFGRRVGENPLEQGVTEAQPVAAPAAPAMPQGPRRRAFPVVAAVAVVVVVASMGAAISLLASSTEEGALTTTAFEEAPVPVPETPAAAAPPAAAPPAEAPAVTGLQPGSMIRRAELKLAVERMRVEELGRPATFRVAAGRIDATLVTPKDQLRIVQVGPSGEPRQIALTGGGGNVPSMSWEDVDPAAPERLVRAAAERAKRSPDEVDYLVLMNLGKPTWGVFFEGGTHYQGDAAGRMTRRVTP